MFMLI
jgi:hypothetical protein